MLKLQECLSNSLIYLFLQRCVSNFSWSNFVVKAIILQEHILIDSTFIIQSWFKSVSTWSFFLLCFELFKHKNFSSTTSFNFLASEEIYFILPKVLFWWKLYFIRNFMTLIRNWLIRKWRGTNFWRRWHCKNLVLYCSYFWQVW